MKTIQYATFCLIVILLFSGNAYSENDSAESLVKKFYQLYILDETNISTYSDLSDYVDGCVLSALQIMYARSYFHTDYFTKSQDTWKVWLDVMTVHKEMKINDTTSVVPVSFKWAEDKQLHLLVFVRKQMVGWRIIKVNGTEHFYE